MDGTSALGDALSDHEPEQTQEAPSAIDGRAQLKAVTGVAHNVVEVREPITPADSASIHVVERPQLVKFRPAVRTSLGAQRGEHLPPLVLRLRIRLQSPRHRAQLGPSQRLPIGSSRESKLVLEPIPPSLVPLNSPFEEIREITSRCPKVVDKIQQDRTGAEQLMDLGHATCSSDRSRNRYGLLGPYLRSRQAATLHRGEQNRRGLPLDCSNGAGPPSGP